MSQDTPRKPECLALILCRRGEGNPLTREANLYGIFSETHTGVQDIHIYVAITSGVGDYRAKFVFEHEESGQTLPIDNLPPIPAKNELQWIDAAVTRRVGFAVPGRYWLKLYLNDQFITQRQFRVVDRPASPSG